MTLIADSGALAEVCSRLATHPFVTVDTEFLRETTFWPKVCVIQIASPDEAVAIDALAEGLDLAPFFALMADESVVKVFHAARQDIEIMVNRGDLVPHPVFDTQVAAMSEAEGPAPEPELTAAEGEDQVGEVVAAETFDFAPSDDGIPLARIPVEAPFLRTAAAMAAHADSPSWAKRPEPAAEPAPDAPAIEAEADLPEVAEVAEETAEETPKRPSRIRRLTLMPSDRTDVAEDIADEQLADISPAIPGADAGAEEDTDASLFAAGDETVIDMDMLRDLVAEIIRQELQGNLGERITRNVRMLVRREVNRALEGRSFE